MIETEKKTLKIILTPQKLRKYLSEIKSKTRDDLISDIEAVGLKMKGRSPDGRFVEFVDKNGVVRAKVHPPDKVTKYNHLHIYDSKGNPLNSSLKKVPKTSPDAHIEIQ